MTKLSDAKLAALWQGISSRRRAKRGRRHAAYVLAAVALLFLLLRARQASVTHAPAPSTAPLGPESAHAGSGL